MELINSLLSDPVGILIVVIFLSTVTVEIAFTSLSTAKRLLDAGIDMPLDMKAVFYFLLIVGYPSDVLFNVFRGSWIFREFPREWLFSDRVQRHANGPRGTREHRKAMYWAKILNVSDPGHIRLNQPSKKKTKKG